MPRHRPAVPADPQFPYVGRAVAELTLSQLRTLDCGLPQAQFPQARVIAPNRLATLPEVFALAEGYRAAVRFNIETKVSPTIRPVPRRRPSRRSWRRCAPPVSATG